MDKLIKLIDAGFNKDEIMQLIGATTQPIETTKEVETVEENIEEEAPTETGAELEDSKEAETIKALTDEVASLRKLVQKTNLQNATISEQPKEITASDIIASLIDPTIEK